MPYLLLAARSRILRDPVLEFPAQRDPILGVVAGRDQSEMLAKIAFCLLYLLIGISDARAVWRHDDGHNRIVPL
jgi:hypothetical protein